MLFVSASHQEQPGSFRKGGHAMLDVDLKSHLKGLYHPPDDHPVLVEVPEMRFLMIDGAGDPNTSPAYQEAIEALYGLTYTLKFMLKKRQGITYPVMALEGLWWTPDMREFGMDHKEDLRWTMMLMQPEMVTETLLAEARQQATKKKPSLAPTQARLETFQEGLAAQILHLGPYAVEAPTIARLHAFVRERGYHFRGKHHEIYLSDPRRSAPAKLKTIIRQPIR
jgi:hypothetical protein